MRGNLQDEEVEDPGVSQSLVGVVYCLDKDFLEIIVDGSCWQLQ